MYPEFFQKRLNMAVFLMTVEVLTAVIMYCMPIVSSDVTPCSLVEVYRRFRETYCLHLRRQK
jgi:hypothetical protein